MTGALNHEEGLLTTDPIYIPWCIEKTLQLCGNMNVHMLNTMPNKCHPILQDFLQISTFLKEHE